MKDDENTKSNIEKDEEKRNDIEANDIRSRLRKNPNKTKPLYADGYSDKKNKKKAVFPPNEKEICRTILDILKKDEKSTLFRQPAIKAFTDKEDRDYYKQQIKEPRDLGNISKKLKSSKYSAKEFYEDVELCWYNAQSFNDIETEAYKNSVYMKDLSNKLYKEYGLLDIINKKENNNISENITENNDNNEIIDNTSENNENKNGNDNDNDNDSIKTNSNILNNNETKKKKVGRKRKRYNDINENFIDKEAVKKIGKKVVNNEREGKNSMASNSSRTIRSTIFDIKNKFKVIHPIVSNPDEIEILLKNMNSNKGNANKRNNISNSSKNNSKKKKKTHYHHKKKQHLGHLKNIEEINSKKLYKNNNTEIIRKINYEWNEIIGFNESINHCINNKNDNLKEKINDEDMKININNNYNSNNSQNDKENNNLNNYNIFNVYNILDNNIISDNQKNKNINLKLNLEKSNKAENEDMTKFDYNCNEEHILDLEAMMENKRKSYLRQYKQSSDINRNNNQYNNNFEQNHQNYLGNRNNTRKTMDKNFKLKNDIAKYLDKLSDNNMIELLVFIENIRPQCIKELDNDTIYINMELFNDDTFVKVIDFLKKNA